MWSCGLSRLASLSLLALWGPAVVAAAPAEREVIATLGGEPVYRDEVEPSVALQIFKLEARIHALLAQATADVVHERLLREEAAARGLSIEELLAREIDAQVGPVGETEVEAYLREHPAETAGAREARERVAFYLNERRRIERRLAFLKELEENAGFAFLLPEPSPPRTTLDLRGLPWRGTEDAPVTLVHFAAFDAASASSAERIRALMEELPGKIRWVHSPFFAGADEPALAAAELAFAAIEAGRFWPLHDRLMALGGTARQADLASLARELDLPWPGTGPERAGRLAAIKRALDLARKAGVTHTPVLFANGRYYSGTFPVSRLRRMVLEELEAGRGETPRGEARNTNSGTEIEEGN